MNYEYSIPEQIRKDIDMYIEQTFQNNINLNSIYSLFGKCTEFAISHFLEPNHIKLHDIALNYISTIYNDTIMDFYLNSKQNVTFDYTQYTPLSKIFKIYCKDNAPYQELSTFLKNKYKKLREQHSEIDSFFSKHGFTYTLSDDPLNHQTKYYLHKDYALSIIHFIDNTKYYNLSRDRFKLALCATTTTQILQHSPYPLLAQYLLEQNTHLNINLYFLEGTLRFLYTPNKPKKQETIYEFSETDKLINYLGNISMSLFINNPILRINIFKLCHENRTDSNLIYDCIYFSSILSPIYLYALNRLNHLSEPQSILLIIEKELLTQTTNNNYVNILENIYKDSTVFGKFPKWEELSGSRQKYLTEGLENLLKTINDVITYMKKTSVLQIFSSDKSAVNIFSQNIYNPTDFISFIQLSQSYFESKLTKVIEHEIIPYLIK